MQRRHRHRPGGADRRIERRLWFFHPDNLELLVKVLDGRVVNGHWWVFHGGLSDVAYTLTVTDLLGGSTATYGNPPFTLSGGAETAAFPDPPSAGVREFRR